MFEPAFLMRLTQRTPTARVASVFVACLVLFSACRTPQAGGERRERDPDASILSPGATAASCEELSCEDPATCQLEAGRARCVCPEGFATDRTDPERCDDVDECATAANDCDQNATCKNREGGFDCACNEGYTGDGRQCRSAGNCEGLTNTCHADAVCTRTTDSASGVTCACADGFEGDGQLCNDVDECEQNGATCAAHAHCVNQRGSFDCPCDPLFQRSDAACVDACEIASRDPARCDPAGHGRCAFAPDGTASCTSCLPDSLAASSNSGASCLVDAACQALACGANTICAGAPSARACVCAPGFTGDPKTGCTDTDECAAGSSNCDPATSQCLNTPGGYVCDCLVGFEHVAGSGGACVNIDECARGLALCDPAATCTDLPVGYKCDCKAGFVGSGYACEDVDECADGTAACADNCQNTQGGYQCACPAGFTGDPTTGACYCDLSGYWAVRQKATLTLPERSVGNVVLIERVTTQATIWELHRYSYDGTTIQVSKQQCGADRAGEIYSPLYMETYSSFTPNSVLERVPLKRTGDIPLDRSAALPNQPFITPRDALVQGIHLNDPVNDPWPKTFLDVPDDAWEDSDEDGEPGLSLWPGKTSQQTASGRGSFSYLPVALEGDSTRIATRAGCVSTALRTIGHLEGTIQSCTRLAGKVISDKTEGRVHSCTALRMTDWDETDVTCTRADWADARPCNEAQIKFLDDQDQTTAASADFESVKIGDLNATNMDCAAVRDALPAL